MTPQLRELLQFHPHYDVWALVFVLAFGYWYLSTRIGPRILPAGSVTTTRRQNYQFAAGLFALWVVSDWPFHDIGEESLFAFHMVEHLTIGLIAAPLLLISVPKWMAKHLIHEAKQIAVLRALSHPAPAFFIFNAVLAGLHWPVIIDLMVTSPIVHFAVHTALFGAALLMWMPVVSPHPDIPALKPPGAMMYLFAQSLIPTVPASFLVFGNTPLYSYYAEVPKLWGWTPMADQAVAGIIMKLGGGFLLWGAITVIWFRWYLAERRWDELEKSLRSEEPV